MHFFITGHTGFKGAWLTLMLRQLGHKVSGLALEPVDGGLFSLANLETEMESHVIADIRDFEAVTKAVREVKPDFAIHMAAQPLVLRSYEDPVETYTTNVDGTLNFLRAITEMEKPPISLVITTDKVYRDDNKAAYKESDALGGHDPYSASKAMADILTQSWIATNPQLKLFVARAGNVIGMFDVSENRIIPDITKAADSGVVLEIRNPESVRPWQHVFDCLTGYLCLLLAADKRKDLPKVFNFGPEYDSARSVRDLVAVAKSFVANLETLEAEVPNAQKETSFLALDSSRAEAVLGWRNLIDFEQGVGLSLEMPNLGSPKLVAEKQLGSFLDLGARAWLTA